MAATKSVILSAVVCLAAVICSCEGMGIHTQPSLAVLVGDMVKKLTSASPSCDPSLANPCGCCCGKNDGVQMSDCHIAASFMVSSGQCPDFLPYSTSSSCTNPTPYSEAGCVSGTSVEDLVNLCHLEGRNCDHSKEEACGCLNEYIGSCFLVNNTSPDLFKEPCALPRARALHHVTALCPNLTSVAVQGCVKPPIRQGMAVKDDCSASTAVGGTCQMTCAEGYVPSPTSTSKIDLTCTSAGFVISGGNMDCIEVPGCDSSSFLSLGDNVRGVVTDCPKRTPLGSHCMMACAEGYVSLADRRVEANCQQSADGVVAFSPTVTCVSSICSTSVIPSGVVHDCGVNSSIIGSTCTLKCPPGYVGNSVQAVCVGHGGLATVPYAEYSFADVVCNYVGLDAPQITKLTLSVVLSYGSMLLDTQPPFHSGLTNATLSLPYRYSVIRLVSTTSGSLSYLCSNCTSTTTDGTFGLSVGSQNISIIVTSPSDRNIVRTFLLQVTREADDTPPASLATQSAQNGTVANATTPTATNNATTALNGTLASGNITANNNTDFVDRSKVWLQSTLRLDLIFTSDFQTRYQAPVTAVIADKLGLTSNDFISIAFSSGSVIVNFVIKADPQLKATLEGRFDQIVADDSLRASLCLAAGVCSVSPVVIVSAFHSVPLPTPTPTPTPTATPTPTPTPLPLCERPEAVSCVQRYVADYCDLPISTPDCTMYIECQYRARTNTTMGCPSNPSQTMCLTNGARQCVRQMLVNQCDLDESVQCRRYMKCQITALTDPSNTCNNTIAKLCSLSGQRTCISQMVSETMCDSAITTDQCRFTTQCQQWAMTNPTSGCPADGKPIHCASNAARHCVSRFSTNRCRRYVRNAHCGLYVPCQTNALTDASLCPQPKCNTTGAYQCIRSFVHNRCLAPAKNCLEYSNCNSQYGLDTHSCSLPNFLVPTPTPAPTPNCQSPLAKACVSRFVSLGCEKVMMMGKCGETVACQLSALADPVSGCPAEVVARHSQPAAMPSQLMMWFRMMMFYQTNPLMYAYLTSVYEYIARYTHYPNQYGVAGFM